MSTRSTSSYRTGRSGYSARSSLLSSSSDNSGTKGGRGSRGQTKFQRDVATAILNGLSDCANPMHWRVVTKPGPRGQTWTDAAVKCHREILTMMNPGPATCSCEKKACEWAWDPKHGWNVRGKYTTEWVLAGRHEKGIPNTEKGASSRAARRVRPMYHSVGEDVVDKLNARFTDTFFVPLGGAGHDHPLAHYSYKMCAESVFDKLDKGTPQAPLYYIDVNGNPTSNENFMRRNPGIVIITVVELITPKDYMRRAQKWGPKFGPDGKQRYVDDIYWRDLPKHLTEFNGVRITPDMIHGITSIHTAYYYAGDEVSMLLAFYDRAVFYALMHRFPTMRGSLNNGEQVWEKVPTATGVNVLQTNVATGEAYNHPDNDWWFNNDSRMYQDNAFGWTMSMVAEESYLFCATTCPVVQARMSTMCLENRIVNTGLTKANGAAQTKEEMLLARKVVCSFYGVQAHMNIDPVHVDLFDELRSSMMGKARTAADYRDHLARSRTKAKGSLGCRHAPIDAQSLKDIALFSFCIDFEDDFKTDSRMFSSQMLTTLHADTLYKTGGSVSGTLLSSLMHIAMDCADAKNSAQMVSRGVRGVLRHGQAAGALRVLN